MGPVDTVSKLSPIWNYLLLGVDITDTFAVHNGIHCIEARYQPLIVSACGVTLGRLTCR